MSQVLPPELVAEILSWLPAVDILRFKCTCKSWYTITKDPCFIKLHHTHSIQSTNADPIIISLHLNHTMSSRYSNLYNPHRGPFYHQYDDKLEKVLEIHLPSHKYDHGRIYCNDGLVCLAERGSVFHKFVVLNPLIGKGKNFQFDPIQPYPTSCIPEIDIGFGYDAVNDDYKAVRVLNYGKKRIQSSLYPSASEVSVVSLKSNSCRRVQDWPFGWWCSAKFSLSVFFNGALHYCPRFWCKNMNVDEKPEIVVFDLTKEEFTVHKIPQFILQDKGSTGVVHTAGLTVLGGHLSLYMNDISSHDVWILEGCGRTYDTWTKLYSIGRDAAGIHILQMKPLYLSKIDGVDRLVLLVEGRNSFSVIYCYDLQKKTCHSYVLLGLTSCAGDFFVCHGKLFFSDSGVDIEKLNSGR